MWKIHMNYYQEHSMEIQTEIKTVAPLAPIQLFPFLRWVTSWGVTHEVGVTQPLHSFKLWNCKKKFKHLWRCELRGGSTGVARGGKCHPKKRPCHPSCHPSWQRRGGLRSRAPPFSPSVVGPGWVTIVRTLPPRLGCCIYFCHRVPPLKISWHPLATPWIFF